MSAVDVVVPCYNYGRFLKSCVDSVLSQRDVVVRILIIDDASSDNTAAIGEGLASDDTRVTFRRHEVNQGLIKTANEGVLDWARAPYTLLISADDALTPGSLARATQVLDTHPEAGMIYGMAQIIDDDDIPGDALDAPEPTYQILSGQGFLKWCCENGNPVPSPTAVVRTELQQSTGGYCAKMPQTSDMEMWMRAATLSAIGFIRQTQAYYRWHDTSMARQHFRGLRTLFRENATTCEHVYAEWGGDKIPEFDLWIRQMKFSYAKLAIRRASSAIDNSDWEEYRNCITFADELNPFWRVSAISWRLRAKRLLGRNLWRWLRQLARLLGYSDGARTANAASGRRIGWWPADY